MFRNLQDYEGLPDRPPIQRFLVAGGTGLETKLAEAIEQIEAIVDEQQELLPFLESLRSSERGIIR